VTLVSPALRGSTIVEALRLRAADEPAGVAAVLVRPDRADEILRFSDVLLLANHFADYLRTLGETAAGSSPRVVNVCLYHGATLHAAFIGAMLAGYLPSMIAPPSPRMEKQKYVDSFTRMLAHIEPAFVITERAVIDALSELRPNALSGRRIVDAALVHASFDPAARTLADVRYPEAHENDVALLQHSSGTTGLQKGVALSHKAVLTQIARYSAVIELSRDDVIASWLPLYHDMGFIACFIMPLVTGVPVVEISPFDWVNRPQLLLEAIERHRATFCWLPNFAYVFMSKSIREGHPDLSSIRAFINCSEPVMASTHRAFASRFSVPPEKLTACYAMAENVFAVTQSAMHEAPRVDRIDRGVFEREHRAQPAPEGGLEFVSNGRPIGEVEVTVVDADGHVIPERQVGEICIRGTSLFSGYFGRRDLTEHAFMGDRYKTGDLGYLADGELFVTGRKKDLIVIQGRNFYPSDIEAEVSAVDGVIDGRVAAFGESDPETGTEALIIIAECEVDDATARARLELAIRKRVAQSFDCTASGVHLVPRQWLIKSTAGKVARSDNRAKYERDLKR